MLYRLANEMTALLAGLLGYGAVLAALGVLVVSILEIDGQGTGMTSMPRADLTAVEPSHGAATVGDDRIDAGGQPKLRQSMAESVTAR
jgi:hypothetical protein